MGSFEWLRLCAEGQTDGCVPPVQAAYLADKFIVGAVVLAIAARRSRDLRPRP